MLEHFLDKGARAIQGKGRAMVITRSRLHAVKFYLMFKKMMKEHKLPFKPLVAFSGTVKDPDTQKEHTEISLNGLAPKVSIPDALKIPEYRILIVANKFQTGFDEPLLHTMYVDKKLGGVNAVQALSRLNRTMKGKDGTIILDFVNDAEDIQSAFQPYYQVTYLEDETNPNKLYDIRIDLEKFEFYTTDDVNEFAEIFYDANIPAEKLQPVLDRVVGVWKSKLEDEREDFRGILQSFTRLYGFVSQLITFQDVDLEKLYAFAMHLKRKLPKRENRLPYEVIDAVDLDSFRIQETFRGELALVKDDSDIPGISSGAPTMTDEEKDILSNILKALNEAHGTDFSDEEKVDIKQIKAQLEGDETLREFAINETNSIDNVRLKFDEAVDDLLIGFVQNKLDLYKKLNEPKVKALFKRKWFDGYQKQMMGK
jgi:type I restriction enzyme R subunit